MLSYLFSTKDLVPFVREDSDPFCLDTPFIVLTQMKLKVKLKMKSYPVSN